MTSTWSSSEADVTRFSIHNKRKNFTFHMWAVVWIILNTVCADFFLRLQIFQYTCIELSIFAAHLAHGFATARGFGMFFLGFVESFFVNVKSLLTGDVTRDLEGKSVGGVEVEGFVTVESGFV